LGDEGERWKSSVSELHREEGKLNGNVFVAAASISYFGPFTVRKQLLPHMNFRDCTEKN